MRIFIFLLYFILNQSFAHQYEKNGISISHPILKMVANDGKMGAGYFKIKNNSGMSLNEINQELIKIYGEQVSFNPSKNHFLLWLMPLILLLIIFIFIRNK